MCADTGSVKTEIMKKHLNSIYSKVVYDLDKIYGENDMNKRKFIVVHSSDETQDKIIVFCDSIDAYADNEIRLNSGYYIGCEETGREICELLRAKGVI